MLKHIKFTVTFPTPAPGRTFSQDLELHSGLTAVTGPNGKGKSLVLEMIQYANFGSPALRGKAEDYDHLEVELTQEIKGTTYTVKRSKKEVLLLEGDTPITTGTKPVNAAIVNLLGYGFEVFQVGNVANQGCIEALGNMKPTERKKLVDETIGLNVLDQLSEFISAEAKEQTTTIKVLEKLLVTPVIPQLVEGYRVSTDLAKELAELQEQITTKKLVAAVAARPKPLPLEEPKGHPKATLLDAYKAEQEERKKHLSEVEFLKKDIASIVLSETPLVTVREADDLELDNYEQEQIVRQKHLTRMELLSKQVLEIPEALFSSETVDAFEAQQQLETRWKEKQKLLANNVPHDCPKCKHHWEDVDPRVESEYVDVPVERPDVIHSATATARFRKELADQAVKESLQPGLEEATAAFELCTDRSEDIKRIKATREAVSASEVGIANQQRVNHLNAKLVALNAHLMATGDKSELIAEIEAAVEQVKNWVKNAPARLEIDQAVESLKSFPTTLETKFAELTALYPLCLAYEIKLSVFAKDTVVFQETQEEIAAQKALLNDWEKAKKAVLDLRTNVKAHLLPSLNSVASYLINDMTGGVLTWIKVDENFEVEVEGQRLELLSGSGRAVANLALRLALGQVLTNKVFSVVLLDEIDASMDNERAAYIAQCLRNLTQTIKQVILISHKPETEANQHIRL